MKKDFTKEYIEINRGCYELEEVSALKCINNKKITLKQLFIDLPIKDFCWFIVNKCDLTLTEKRLFALHCAKQVLPIYEKSYPNDDRVRKCIEGTENFLNGEISSDDLVELRRASAASATSAASAYASVSASASASAYAAASATSAASAYASVSASASASAYAAASATSVSAYSDDAYGQSIWEFVETLK